MIIEQHITPPKGYLSARYITFRGLPEEEADAPEDVAVGARNEPVWERFVEQILAFDMPFTVADIHGFSNQQASRYLTKATRRGMIRKMEQKIQHGPGRPKFVYEVAR